LALLFSLFLRGHLSARLNDEHRSALENVIQQFGDVMTSDEALARLRGRENA
jgi:hypothetical protein